MITALFPILHFLKIISQLQCCKKIGENIPVIHFARNILLAIFN